MKKITIFVIVSVIVASVLLAGCERGQKANPIDEFEYFFATDDTAHIVDYFGNDKTVVIPSEIDGRVVDYISSRAFANSTIKSVVIPDSVEIIGSSAFLNCDNLESVEFGSKITEIRDSAFAFCDKLQKVVLPENLQEIEKEAFRQCAALEEVYIPKTVTDFGTGTFQECTVLEKVILEEGIEEINGYMILHGCNAIKEFSIPASMKKMKKYCFGKCKSLEVIKTYGNAPETDAEAFYVIDPKKVTIYYKEGTTGWDKAPYNNYTLKVH